MRLSEERVSVLARMICDRLLDEELADLEISEDDFVFQVENLILKDLKIEDEIDEEATTFILKISNCRNSKSDGQFLKCGEILVILHTSSSSVKPCNYVISSLNFFWC